MNTLILRTDGALLLPSAEVCRKQPSPRIPVKDSMQATQVTGDTPPTEDSDRPLHIPVTDSVQAVCLPHNTPPTEGCEWVPLRKAYTLMSPDDYRTARRAAHLLHWHLHSRYCPVCGAPNQVTGPGCKHCGRCGYEQFAPVTPAAIVRIERLLPEPAVLLVHAHTFTQPRYYGLVAGFVEPGENAEECVRRETLEETNLHLTGLRYFTSQHWPYPQQLMLAFTAHADNPDDLRFNDAELTDALWATRSEIVGWLESPDSDKPHIPDSASVARMLIDDWINTCPQGTH